MTFPRARLAVAASLFVAWLCYLLSLVLVSQHTIVLSRPQFLVTSLCVVADLTDDNDGKPALAVKIDEVFWGPANLKGATIDISNLADAGPQGYAGPDKYILPLQVLKTNAGAVYQIAVVPSSPRYEPAFVDVNLYSIGAGADKELAIRLACELFGLSEADARTGISHVVDDKQPVALARHVATEQFRTFREQLPDAVVEPVGKDVRIYRVTPETLKQLEEIVNAR